MIRLVCFYLFLGGGGGRPQVQHHFHYILLRVCIISTINPVDIHLGPLVEAGFASEDSLLPL